MARLSIVLGVLGFFGTGAAVPYLCSRVSNWRAQHHWLLGLAALVPAWLIAFLGLLGLPAGERDFLPPSVILSSGAALLGIIFTDMAVRRIDKSGHSLSPLAYWFLGVIGLVPAWSIALWILL